jgi:hypothetical protein
MAGDSKKKTQPLPCFCTEDNHCFVHGQKEGQQQTQSLFCSWTERRSAADTIIVLFMDRKWVSSRHNLSFGHGEKVDQQQTQPFFCSWTESRSAADTTFFLFLGQKVGQQQTQPFFCSLDRK